MRRALALAVAGTVVVLTASASSASTTEEPSASTTEAPKQITEHGEVVLKGVIDEPPGEGTGVAELRLTGPGVEGVAVARSGRPSPEEPQRDPASVTFPLRTAPCNLPGDVCAGGAVLANGVWTVQLFEVDRPADDQEIARGEPARVVVDVPALPPEDVSAVLEGRTVTVAWARGVGPEQALVEPDVRWTVADGTGRAVTVGPEACADGRCSTAFAYADDASGPRRFTVAASRSETAEPTATAAPDDVVVPAVPGASPGPSAGASGGPGASGAPGGGGGSGLATARSLRDGLSRFTPAVPTLPGLPSGSPPSVASPQVADTFDPTLTYEAPREDESGVPEPQAAQPPSGRESVLTSNDALVDDAAARSIAGALVLLLAGAHLRTWLSGSRPDGG